MGRKSKEITWEMNGDCMECTSHIENRYGYPQISIDGKAWRISRYLYTQKHGEIPKGMFICHTCDNPPCINIDHLVIGTPQDNMDDMVKRGRSLKGIKNKNVKLTDEIVREIRADKISSNKELAKKYNVSIPNIHHIRKYKLWKHI